MPGCIPHRHCEQPLPPLPTIGLRRASNNGHRDHDKLRKPLRRAYVFNSDSLERYASPVETGGVPPAPFKQAACN
jgi:hypothetical protein